MQPVVNPIVMTSKKSPGVRTRLTMSQKRSSATRSSPTELTVPGRGMRVARLGAEASAATAARLYCVRGGNPNQALPGIGGGRGYDGAEPEWRNWFTRCSQKALPFGACGFESHLRHELTRQSA